MIYNALGEFLCTSGEESLTPHRGICERAVALKLSKKKAK